MKKALVCGAGGFIGSHLVKRLKAEGYWVRGVDVKYPEFSDSPADEFLILDLSIYNNVRAAFKLEFIGMDSQTPLPFSYNVTAYSEQRGFDEVYQLAADMGGAGYVFSGENDANIMTHSALINLHVASVAVETKVKKLFYSSSACMYPQEKQTGEENESLSYTGYHPTLSQRVSLKESDAYPANPDSEYGWEKLFSERLYLAHARNYGLNVRIARFHNIYGPEGTYQGGKEKAPAAMCRKVITSERREEDQIFDEIGDRWVGGYGIEIWGDGEQTRSFLYIDDCLDAVRLLMESDHSEPINIGSEEMVSINDLADLAISNEPGVIFTKKHIDGPTGVRGRNSDNTLIRQVLGWDPKVNLEDGIERTYNWIKSRYEKDN